MQTRPIPNARKRLIKIEGEIELRALAQRMEIKAPELLMQLLKLGAAGVHINSTLDPETAQLVAAELGWELQNQERSADERVAEARGALADQLADRVARAPVVTVMGHVDHGKTSLLDRIRASNVASREAGGITQHIGAYRVDGPRGPIVFLDTPGHEAFTAMRARGANSTDLVVLVVAADDGVMPQTREALHHAQAAKVPVIVALNKIDRPKTQLDAILNELASEGLKPEAWGGDTQYVETSAATGQGIPQLLEAIALQAELAQLRSNPKLPAAGVVLEAYLDRGRGPVANVLLRDGVLRRGDFVVAGDAWGKVRALSDDRGRLLELATPETPVELIGLSQPAAAGDPVYAVIDQKHARELASGLSRKAQPHPPLRAAPRTLDHVQTLLRQADKPRLALVIKADVHGSAEALRQALSELPNDQVELEIIYSGVGAITQNDVALASAGSALVIGFGVRAEHQASLLAKRQNIEIRQYRVIYAVLEDIERAMRGKLAPAQTERELGKAQVRQLFQLPKQPTVAGCMVLDGKLLRTARARVMRDGNPIWEGRIAGLRRFKDDVREVTTGHECGVQLENFSAIQEHDIIQCFELEQTAAAA